MDNKDWLTLGMALAGATAGGFAGRKYEVEETDKKTGDKKKKKKGLGVVPGALLGGLLAAKGGLLLGDRVFKDPVQPVSPTVENMVDNAVEDARKEEEKQKPEPVVEPRPVIKKPEANKDKKPSQQIVEDAGWLTTWLPKPFKLPKLLP